MIGYLYAIDLGAKYIYETDDDNSPLDGLFNFRYFNFKGLEQNCEVDTDSKLFVNPYSFFGQPTVWPRGYPLERISNEKYKQFYECFNYSIYQHQVPLIQQGLVNGDPDVDAIYRLTRKYFKKKLDFKFDDNAPALILNKNQYAPINSQNTFFHYDAFWSLIFPLNVTFRECDILRGYISIRLLQEINGRVAFIRPNAIQYRNAHSYHKDYLEEQRLYSSIENFVQDLNKWICEKDLLSECLIDCVKYLIVKGHLNEVELNFYKEWINDLNKLNYKWPSIKRFENFEKSQEKVCLIYKSIEQNQTSNSNENQMSLKILNQKLNSNKCNLNRINDIVLITLINDDKTLNYFLYNSPFLYYIICTNNKYLINENFINENFGYLFIYLKYNETYLDCVEYSTKIGFKQQSYLLFKNVNHLIRTLSELNEFSKVEKYEDSDFEESFFYIRKNVANGIRRSGVLKNNSQLTNIENICEFNYSNLFNSIEKLKWHSNDLAAENCENLPVRTVWIPDLHDGPRVDLSSTLVYLGQNAILAGHKKYSSPYKNALNMSKVTDQLSNYVLKFTSIHSDGFTDEDARENYEFYKKSSDFQNVDLIICSFPSSLCDCFIPLNKTIIFNPAHRYNLAKCSQKKWLKLNELYEKLNKKNKLITSAMSRYDYEYHTYFTNYKPFRLYAYGGFYANKIDYNPVKDEILVGPSNKMGPGGQTILDELNKYSNEFTFKHIRKIYPVYTLDQLANHRAIVIFPYAVMSYSIVDFYISNIPIFVPSIEIINKYKMVNDRNVNSSIICPKYDFEDIVPSFNGLFHNYSPNDDSDDAYKYWISYADYFTWPYVTVFYSIEDLINKLKNLDLVQISNKMKAFNKIKETSFLDNWCRILKKVDSKQPVPDSFEKALDYFNLKSIYD